MEQGSHPVQEFHLGAEVRLRDEICGIQARKIHGIDLCESIGRLRTEGVFPVFALFDGNTTPFSVSGDRGGQDQQGEPKSFSSTAMIGSQHFTFRQDFKIMKDFMCFRTQEGVLDGKSPVDRDTLQGSPESDDNILQMFSLFRRIQLRLPVDRWGVLLLSILLASCSPFGDASKIGDRYRPGRVLASTPLQGFTYSSSSYSFTKGVAATSGLPTFTSGTPTQFSIAPALPSGLNLNSTTGLISGTPTTAIASASYTVTATGASSSAQKVLSIAVLSTSPTTSTVVAAAATAPADGTTTVQITVTLKDANGVGVPGQNVTLSSPRGATDTITGSPAVSNASGVATFTVSSTTSGSPTFFAQDTSDSVLLINTATVSFQNLSASKLAFSVQPSASGNTDSDLAVSPVVQIQDSGGNLVPNAGDNVTLAAFSDANCTTLVPGGVTATSNPVAAVNGSATFASRVRLP
ncbi:hypothetical protein EB061_10045 [bacterium]|nr:hypothetical protein [bacterium]